jgi:hypothetical protein
MGFQNEVEIWASTLLPTTLLHCNIEVFTFVQR